jgi:hypothetical protein
MFRYTLLTLLALVLPLFAQTPIEPEVHFFPPRQVP